jgi:hypothetical protein
MGMQNIQLNNIVAATPSDIDRVRYPEQLFTDGYLNDEIRFRPDRRFQQRTLVQQLDVLPDQISRDFAEFLQVRFGDDVPPQYFAINLYSPVWSRSLYEQAIGPQRRAFTQLGQRRA